MRTTRGKNIAITKVRDSRENSLFLAGLDIDTTCAERGAEMALCGEAPKIAMPEVIAAHTRSAVKDGVRVKQREST